MKKFTFLILLLISSGMLTAQSQSSTGIFISPIMEISEVDGHNNLSFGFGGGVQFGNIFFGGFHAQSLHSICSQNLQTIRTGEIKGTGLWLGKTVPVNEHQRIVFGAKTALQTVQLELLETKSKDATINDRFWSIAPEAGMEWKLGKTAWLNMAAAYKVVGGMDNDFLDNQDLSSLTLSISLKLGIWRPQ